MRLALTEDQTILAKTASAFAAERAPLARVRKLRDANDPLGYAKEMWSEMARRGGTGIPFAEEDGGAGLGLAGGVVGPGVLGRWPAPEAVGSPRWVGGGAHA